MRILSIDPASQCGWAYLTIGGGYASGTWDLSTRRDESNGMKLIRFEAKLREIATLGIDLIVYETPALHTKFPLALVSHSKLCGIIEMFAVEIGCEYKGIAPKDLKKRTTGKGTANKDMMTAAVRERFGYTGNDHNEADAIALLHMAVADYGANVRKVASRQAPVVAAEETPF